MGIELPTSVETGSEVRFDRTPRVYETRLDNLHRSSQIVYHPSSKVDWERKIKNTRIGVIGPLPIAQAPMVMVLPYGADSEELSFRGKDATECEEFIAAILKHAFARGKQRDDQWMADFAATCLANDALRWWSGLDEEVQGSWKLLRRAMFSKYRPVFHGGSGEEAEIFIRTVCDKAIDEGKQKDYEWTALYASSCLAGEALRWYASLDLNTQEDWKKLQQAILVKYPRDLLGGALLK
ncbi:hypothetical protein FS837_002872 [Tulasnella sp. UAMH 9824]|nr:hypothetical protein FS837_002872 [Tulasnella sp. UAMH 9824]